MSVVVRYKGLLNQLNTTRTAPPMPERMERKKKRRGGALFLEGVRQVGVIIVPLMDHESSMRGPLSPN